MHVLLIHNEAAYFGGAETMFGYFLQGLAQARVEVTVAAVADSRVARLIPPEMRAIWISDNRRLSPLKALAQACVLRKAWAGARFDLVHGWSAREWGLSALVGFLARRPAMGTLHDHPAASFISPARRRLMRWSAAGGLRQVVCVSEAVRTACVNAGYAAGKLTVVHNGLPELPATPRGAPAEVCRLGYLGVFSERKGMRGLFAVLAELARLTSLPWELRLAGGPQDASGERLWAELRQQYSQASWWCQVTWCGWVEDPQQFLSAVDLLLVPSTDFDPLPTVLIEAGQAGVPAVAARVGGVAEIVSDGRTGWLFEPGNWPEAARILADLTAQPTMVRSAGTEARRTIASEFTLSRMTTKYREAYSRICNQAP